MNPPIPTPRLLAALITTLITGHALAATPAAEAPTAHAAQANVPAKRLDDLAAQLAETVRHIQDLQTQIKQLGSQVDANGKALANLSSREGNNEKILAVHQKQLEMNTQVLYANTERLNQLQMSLAAAQQSLATLRAQMGQVEGALMNQGAWLARHNIDNATISATANEALQRAQAAGKLAEGKLLYEEVLAEHLTLFPAYKTTLGDESKAVLKDFAEKLKAENGNVYLEIQGHTDNSGWKRHNKKLAQQRAEAVRDYLNTDCGIPLHRMAAVSYGDSKPIADNKTKEGRSQNRRVTLVVLK